jgi:hypothetical protein
MAALEKLRDAGLLSVPDAEVLIAAAGLQHALTQVLRIALDETPVIEDATPGLKGLLTRAAEAGSFAEAHARLIDLQGATRAIFNRLLAVP